MAADPSAAVIKNPNTNVLKGTLILPQDVWKIVSANYSASNFDQIQADTSSSSFSITLPSTPIVGYGIYIQDAKLTWGANNLTINRNGSPLNGVSSNYTANVSGGKISIVYIDNVYGWSVK